MTLACYFLRSVRRSAAVSVAFSQGRKVMLRPAKVAISFVLVAFSLMMVGTPDANAGSKLPDSIKAGFAEKLFRLDCGRSLANDESVWTPGENVGSNIEFSSTCWLQNMETNGCFGMRVFLGPRTTIPEVGPLYPS